MAEVTVTITLTPMQIRSIQAQIGVAENIQQPQSVEQVATVKVATKSRTTKKPKTRWGLAVVAPKAPKAKRVMSIDTQIKMTQGALASPKTPNQLRPGLTARLEKLLAQVQQPA